MLDIKRREFIALLGGAVAWPYVAAAQGAKKRPVIGMLGQGTPAQLKGVQLRQYFLNGMRELGYVEGRDFDIIGRLAESTSDLPRAKREYSQAPRPKTKGIVTLLQMDSSCADSPVRVRYTSDALIASVPSLQHNQNPVCASEPKPEACPFPFYVGLRMLA